MADGKLTSFQEAFLLAQKRGVPLIGVTSTDQQATLSNLFNSLHGPRPLLVWDIVRGLTGFEGKGESLAETINRSTKPGAFEGPTGFTSLLAFLQSNFEDLPTQVFCLAALNIHRGLQDSAVIQAILNARNWLSEGGELNGQRYANTLAFLSPVFTWPLELSQDIYSLEDSPPSDKELLEIISEATEWAGASLPTTEKLQQGAEALLSLNKFAATQEVALALSASDPNWIEGLGSRRRARVNSTPGLEMIEGKTDFSAVGGYESAKGFLKQLFGGPLGIKSIMFFDEIEKQLGNQNDSSGVSIRMLGTILSYMSDNKVSGILFHGVPGSGKSALAQACSGEFKVPFVSNDLSAVQNSLVGKSEEQLRANLAIDKALGRGKSLWVATCNEIERIPAPLLRRFDLATFTFDIPSQEEQATIWPIQMQAFGLDASQPLPENTGLWTGSDIQRCCKVAFSLSIPLVQAASYVIPIAVARPEVIQKCHEEADGRLLSASYPGPFRKREKTQGKRAIDLGSTTVAIAAQNPFQFFPSQEPEVLPKKEKIGFGMRGGN